ncbi:hypothetical protein PGT21_034634 [Puccinia graminis f. sp. tritici]|uniref:Uncharacterized protein n=1 Tax=Puccinia graminis f. sp. tritici TaxID=56615 RepID=A0A5B0PZP4_PUCGR|nr:hypothetical protein PGT21_034634 [Puccinia graminis f. sp. tritici]KAA1126401.1 hypothetical protein PGTUg99_030944 [Puccinia graminis f. sp. tritici]
MQDQDLRFSPLNRLHFSLNRYTRPAKVHASHVRVRDLAGYPLELITVGEAFFKLDHIGHCGVRFTNSDFPIPTGRPTRLTS